MVDSTGKFEMHFSSEYLTFLNSWITIMVNYKPGSETNQMDNYFNKTVANSQYWAQ